MPGGISAAICLSVAKHRVEFFFGGVGQIGAARREQHLRLEHEAVADDVDIRLVAENRAQPAKEFGAIAGELLDLVGQSDIELLAEVGDLALLGFDLGLGDVERCRQRRQLLAQRGDLRVQLVDLGQRVGC